MIIKFILLLHYINMCIMLNVYINFHCVFS